MVGQEQFRGIGDLQQSAVGHLEDADLVGRSEAVLHGPENAELVAALALERQYGIDHVLQDLGAGDHAVLGDVADQHKDGAARLGQTDQLLGAAAHLGDAAGRRFQAVQVHGLDRIDDQQGRDVGAVQAGQDIAHRGRGGQSETGRGQAEAVGAQLDLLQRLFAGHIDAVQGLARCAAGQAGHRL